MTSQYPIRSGEQTDQDERGQLNLDAARVYEEFFIPALFQEWPARVVQAAQIHGGQHVLDVACGTGILARAAAHHTGPNGCVVGLDINDAMLSVARQKAAHIEWKQGAAESLPFDDGRFHAVVSQFGLMFFTDRLAAIREMYRVLAPGGRMAVAVWDTLENTPGYAAMVELLHRLFGEWAAVALRAPYTLGDPDGLRSLFNAAGVQDVKVSTYTGTARFPSIDAWIFTDVKGWTLADRMDDAQFAQLLAEARQVLQPFVLRDGSVAFDAPAHIITGVK